MECVPPCVWQLLHDCLPPGECVYEEVSDVFARACVPGTEWRRDFELLPSGKRVFTAYDAVGSLCFRKELEGPNQQIFDEAGTLVATSPDGTNYTCESDGETYVYNSSPSCEPWELDCYEYQGDCTP